MSFRAMYYGGGMAGDMGTGGAGTGGGGLLGGIQALLATLPPWLALIITAVGLLLLAAFIGWLVGQVVGRILYPNPEKTSLLSKQQKFACLGAFVVVFAVVIFALQPETPKVDDGMMVDGPGISDGMNPEEGLPEGELPEGELPEGEVPEGDGADADEGAESKEDAPSVKNPSVNPPVAIPIPRTGGSGGGVVVVG